MYERDYTIVRLLIETIDKIYNYTSDLKSSDDFENDVESFDATMMNFIVLGENVSKLSKNFKKRYNKVEWNKIYAFRNVIAHDYFGILPEEVWQIIKNDLPKFKIHLENIINPHYS